MNGGYVSSTPMPHTDKASAELETVVPVPVVNMRPFSNSLMMQFIFQMAKKGRCQDTAPLQPAGRDPQGLLPRHPATSRTGPCCRTSRSSPTPAIPSRARPTSPTPPSCCRIRPAPTRSRCTSRLMGHFGAQTGYPVLNVTVTNADGMKSDGGKDYIVMGTVEDQPALGTLNQRCPSSVDGSGLHIQDTQGFFAPLQHAWWKVRSSDHIQSGQLETAGGLPDALIEGIEWPTGSNRTPSSSSPCAITAVVPNFLSVFLKNSQSSDISQSVSVLHGTRFVSYRIGNDVYHVGSLSLWVHVNMLFSEYPVADRRRDACSSASSWPPSSARCCAAAPAPAFRATTSTRMNATSSRTLRRRVAAPVRAAPCARAFTRICLTARWSHLPRRPGRLPRTAALAPLGALQPAHHRPAGPRHRPHAQATAPPAKARPTRCSSRWSPTTAPDFDKLLNWTEANLAGGDLTLRLPAWSWGKNPDGSWKILDPNPASDADLWMAYDLLEAGRLWHEPRYESLGSLMASRIAQEEVVAVPGVGTTLLPGPHGFHPDADTWILNPSYLPPSVLVRLCRRHAPRPLELRPRLPPPHPHRRLAQRLRHGLGRRRLHHRALALTRRRPPRVTCSATPSAATTLSASICGSASPTVTPPASSSLLDATSGMAAYLRHARHPAAQGRRLGNVIATDAPVGFSAAVIPYLQALGLKAQAKTGRSPRRHAETRPPASTARIAPTTTRTCILFATGWTEGRFRFDRDGKLR